MPMKSPVLSAASTSSAAASRLHTASPRATFSFSVWSEQKARNLPGCLATSFACDSSVVPIMLGFSSSMSMPYRSMS